MKDSFTSYKKCCPFSVWKFVSIKTEKWVSLYVDPCLKDPVCQVEGSPVVIGLVDVYEAKKQLQVGNETEL